MVPGFAFVLAKIVALDKDVGAVPIVVVFTLRYIMQRSYVCANVGNVRGYRRYVDMYMSAYQRHSPTVGLHAEGLALQCLSFKDNCILSHLKLTQVCVLEQKQLHHVCVDILSKCL